MGFFKVDSPIYEFLRRFVDVVKLNFLWLIFSLPIVTMGAASVAVYTVTLKMTEDNEGYVGREFIKAFKANLKQGIILGLITLAASFVVYLNLSLFFAIESNPLPLLIIGIFAGVYFLLSLLYAYPLTARYQNSLRNNLNNSFRISTKYIGRTLFLILIIAFIVIVCLYNSTTIFFGILIGPTFIMFTISSFSLHIFKKIDKDQ